LRQNHLLRSQHPQDAALLSLTVGSFRFSISFGVSSWKTKNPARFVGQQGFEKSL
jgi:hypothetical protein